MKVHWVDGVEGERRNKEIKKKTTPQENKKTTPDGVGEKEISGVRESGEKV